MLKNSKNKNLWAVFIFLKLMAHIFVNSKFTSKKPNSNGYLEDSLSIMYMSTISISLAIHNHLKRDELYVAAILLRSLIELDANINYLLVEEKNRIQLAKKFLKTTELVTKNLYAIKKAEKLIYVEWADKSITKRVELLGKDISGMYKYLSSYVHSDAGYMGAYYYSFIDNLRDIITLSLILHSFRIINSLGRLNIINSKDVYMKLSALLKEHFDHKNKN